MGKMTSRLTIFEGPDCVGKTTVAKKFAADTDALYFHFPHMPLVSDGLCRMYVEAMMPAILGLKDVVMDRCWLSESIYGTVFRRGLDRIGSINYRILERIAMRCAVTKVFCEIPLESSLELFRIKKIVQMLDNEDQHRKVYAMYNDMHSIVDAPIYNFEKDCYDDPDIFETCRTNPHNLDILSSGNIDAPIAVIGSIHERCNQDPYYQLPFCSFQRRGYENWITSLIIEGDIEERDILWVYSNQDLSIINDIQKQSNIAVICLGKTASSVAEDHGIRFIGIPHPYTSIINDTGEYELIRHVKNILRGLE